MHNQAAYDQIAGLYAARQAERDRSFPDLRPGGCLALVTAAGQGTRLEPVPYAAGEERWFFYREPAELDEQVRGAGLQVVAMSEEPAVRHWLKILACAAR